MNFKFLSGRYEYDRENTIWKTARGRMTPLSWMTNTHIQNCLNCLRGVGESQIPDPYMGKSKYEWIGIFTTELNLRGNENG